MPRKTEGIRNLTLRLPEGLAQEIDELAQVEARSLNNALLVLIMRGLQSPATAAAREHSMPALQSQVEGVTSDEA